MSNVFDTSSLVISDPTARKKYVANNSKACTQWLKDKGVSKPFSVWDWDQKNCEGFIKWYINRNVERALTQAPKATTSNQHTVPNFTNKSFGKIYDHTKFTQEIICNQLVGFAPCVKSLGVQSLEVGYNDETSKWDVIKATPTQTISTFHNIYDSTGFGFPEKFVECFLSEFEGDASRIIQRISKNINNQNISWAERVILACYGVLQESRTVGWKIGRDEGFAQITQMIQRMAPTMTKESAEQTIIDQLGIEIQDFGASVFGSLTLDRINIFLARQWNFFCAPEGLITSLYPLGSYDKDRWYMFSDNLKHPDHLMLPLGRNLLWVLSGPNLEVTLLGKDVILNPDENYFVNEMLSLRVSIIYCHPDDAEIILPKLYRTEAIDYYSDLPSDMVSSSTDPYKIASTVDLFKFVPERMKR